MLGVLDAACQGGMKYGIFWTVWKLCQGLASLSVNDKNKEMITSKVGAPLGAARCGRQASCDYKRKAPRAQAGLVAVGIRRQSFHAMRLPLSNAPVFNRRAAWTFWPRL